MAVKNLKDIGYILELEFAVECMKRGACVSQPIGDNAHYDLLIDNKIRIFRVQVKSSTVDKKYPTKYSINTHRKLPTMSSQSGPSCQSVPYEEGAVDLIVTKANGAWFFFSDCHLLPGSVCVYPDKSFDDNKWNSGKEKWSMLGLG